MDVRDVPGAHVGEAPLADLALADQLAEGEHDLLPGRVGIELVHVVEVDVVGLQAAQAGLDGAPHVEAGEAALVGSVADRVGDLGGQHPAVAGLLEGAADHLLGAAVGVDVGRVDEVDAGVRARGR